MRLSPLTRCRSMHDEGAVGWVDAPGVCAAPDHAMHRRDRTIRELPGEAVCETLAIVDHEIACLMTCEPGSAPEPTSVGVALEVVFNTRRQRRSPWRSRRAWRSPARHGAPPHWQALLITEQMARSRRGAEAVAIGHSSTTQYTRPATACRPFRLCVARAAILHVIRLPPRADAQVAFAHHRCLRCGAVVRPIARKKDGNAAPALRRRNGPASERGADHPVRSAVSQHVRQAVSQAVSQVGGERCEAT
jgi:hypothetical protein